MLFQLSFEDFSIFGGADLKNPPLVSDPGQTRGDSYDGGILKVGPPKKFRLRRAKKSMFLKVLEDLEAKIFPAFGRIPKNFACGALNPL